MKYTLFSMPREAILAESSGAQATEEVFAHCQTLGVDAIGHRVVHGGPRFIAPTRVTASVLQELRSLSALDPVHNPAEVAALELGMRLLPSIPTIAVFDTAFHQSLPPPATPSPMRSRHAWSCGAMGSMARRTSMSPSGFWPALGVRRLAQS